MILQNKITEESGFLLIKNDSFRVVNCANKVLALYESLKDLSNEWEVYEELKEHWFISNNGQVHEENGHDRFRKERQEIGNYFETEEEAKQAVEKLKAWKRLKDKGFRFNGADDACISYEIDTEYWSMQDAQDFRMLFGDEG